MYRIDKDELDFLLGDGPTIVEPRLQMLVGRRDYVELSHCVAMHSFYTLMHEEFTCEAELNCPTNDLTNARRHFLAERTIWRGATKDDFAEMMLWVRSLMWDKHAAMEGI